MDSIPSMKYFRSRLFEFLIKQANVEEDRLEEVGEQIDWFIEKSGGWENHYGIMLEGVSRGYSFEDQLKKTEEIWKTIKFNFGDL